MNLRGKQIARGSKMYDNDNTIKNREKGWSDTDYLVESKVRQNGLRAICKTLEYDIDITPETILQNESLARILSGLP